MAKTIQVKAGKRKGKMVKAHTRTIKKSATGNTTVGGSLGGILSMGQEIKDKYGEKGFFPASNEAPMFQAIMNNHLKEKGWKISDWNGKQITATKGKISKTADYTKLADKYKANAISIGQLFQKL